VEEQANFLGVRSIFPGFAQTCPKKLQKSDLHKKALNVILGAIFSNQRRLGAIFTYIFMELAQIFRDFVNVFRDFLTIPHIFPGFKEFFPDFYQFKTFGAALALPAPHLLHQCNDARLLERMQEKSIWMEGIANSYNEYLSPNLNFTSQNC